MSLAQGLGYTTQITLHLLGLVPFIPFISFLILIYKSTLFLGCKPSSSPADTALVLLCLLNIPNSTDTLFWDSS